MLLTGDEAFKEWLLAEVLIMFLKVLLAWGHQFNCSELEATLLKSGDDVADESTLDTIRLDGDKAIRKFSFTARGEEDLGGAI